MQNGIPARKIAKKHKVKLQSIYSQRAKAKRLGIKLEDKRGGWHKPKLERRRKKIIAELLAGASNTETAAKYKLALTTIKSIKKYATANGICFPISHTPKACNLAVAARRERIARYLRKGMLVRDIAKRMNIKTYLVHFAAAIVRKQGKAPYPIKPDIKKRNESIVADLLTGKTHQELAKKYNVTLSLVKNIKSKETYYKGTVFPKFPIGKVASPAIAKRNKTILKLVANGLTGKQIGERLGIHRGVVYNLNFKSKNGLLRNS